MAPVVTMKQLLEAGVHFGHQTRRWNPKMKRFIFGERNGIYIIDLEQTLQRIETAYTFVRDLVADGGTILFVGTKKQAQDPIQSYAEKCGMPYINQRWLGGMLTNFETISKRVGKMKEYQRMRDAGEFEAMPKKEALLIGRELEKLERNLGGIRNDGEAARRRVHPRHQEGAHRRHRGQQARASRSSPSSTPTATPTSSSTSSPATTTPSAPAPCMCRVIADAVEEGRFIAARRGGGGGPAAGRPHAPRRRPRIAAAAGRGPPPGRRRRRPSARPASPPPPAGPMEQDAEAAATRRGRPPPSPPPSPRRRRRGRRRGAAAEPPPPSPPPRPPTRPRRADPDGRVHRQGRPGPAPGHRRRDDGRQEGARGERRRLRGGRASGCGRRAWPRSASRADRENTEGAVAIAVDGNVAALVELKCETDFVAKSDDFIATVQELADAVAADGEGAVDDAQGPRRRPQGHAQGEHRGRPGRPLRGRRGQRPRHLPAQAGRPRRQGRRRSSSSPAARPELAHDIAVHIAFAKPRVPVPRRGPGRRRRRRAGDAHDDHPQRGQARGRARQDRRGQAQRLVPGARAARAEVRPRREADHRAAARRGRASSASA